MEVKILKVSETLGDSLARDYKTFISNCKTERETIDYATSVLIKNGYKDYKILNNSVFIPGDKVFIEKMGKTVAAFHIGKNAMQNGMNILCAHVDNPRLDVKVNPVYSDTGVVYLDTHYYGGIRKYQWVARPLAIHGVVFKKNGDFVKVCIGENDEDPIFYISDLLPHLAHKSQDSKGSVDFISGESLDIIIGNTVTKKDEKDRDDKEVKGEDPILTILKEKYNIDKDDFKSAELEIVPADKARDVGFDRNLIAGYGHDDRSCAFASLKAFVEAVDIPERTSCLYLVDKEEIGSVGATGFDSNTFENMVAEIVYGTGGNELFLRRCLANSNILSSDVDAAFDPRFSEVFDKKSAAKLGQGVTFVKFTGTRGKSGANDANPEYIAKLRKLAEDNKIDYQMTEMGKVDEGGGGTIAYLAARYGMNTIDIGIPVMSMHAPIEVIDKHDLASATDLYFNFLCNA